MPVIINACKKFGNHSVLNNLDFSMGSESIIGLAGPSGGGKSTLLRCIQGLESLDSGQIVYEGKTGFMFQDFQLFPHMSVLKNLIYAPSLHDSRKNHVDQALALLGELGMADKQDALPARLSGGQKQRVALARSLMMQPDLLLCDEPTSGLDMVSVDEVISLLKCVKSHGVSMIIASHDLLFLTQVSDRIVVLKRGGFVVDMCPLEFSDPVSELKKFY